MVTSFDHCRDGEPELALMTEMARDVDRVVAGKAVASFCLGKAHELRAAQRRHGADLLLVLYKTQDPEALAFVMEVLHQLFDENAKYDGTVEGEIVGKASEGGTAYAYVAVRVADEVKAPPG